MSDRLMIKSLAVGQAAVLSCVIAEASARKTKAGKPYLAMTVFDGQDKLDGNYWDWAGTAMPETKTKVYKVTAEVSEYQGKKQLNIKSIISDAAYSVTDFLPSSGQDMEAVFKEAMKFVDKEVTEPFLHNVCGSILVNYRDRWLEIPGAKGIHHAYVGGTLIHSLSTARIAAAIAEQVPIANKSLVAAGALLHDFGKLWTYKFEGSIVDMTLQGVLFDHLYIGAQKLIGFILSTCEPSNDWELMASDMLVHILLSHHGLQEHGAVVPPSSIEAHIVYCADSIDATGEVIRSTSENTTGLLTERIWTMQNRPAVNYKELQRIRLADDEDLPFH